MSPLFLILALFGLLALSTHAQQVEQLQEDGSAAAISPVLLENEAVFESGKQLLNIID